MESVENGLDPLSLLVGSLSVDEDNNNNNMNMNMNSRSVSSPTIQTRKQQQEVREERSYRREGEKRGAEVKEGWSEVKAAYRPPL